VDASESELDDAELSSSSDSSSPSLSTDGILGCSSTPSSTKNN
jgi:hypothetical protein